MEVRLRHESRDLDRGLDGHEEVAIAVQDERRALHSLECASQPALIGVEEVAGVVVIEGDPIVGAEVGEAEAQHLDGEQLRLVHGVVQRVVAEELELLRAEGGQERERGDSVRRTIREVGGHAASHREADDVDSRDAQLVDELQGVVGVRQDRGVRDVGPRTAEPREARRDRLAVLGEERRQAVEVAERAGAAVEQQDGQRGGVRTVGGG